MKEFKRMKIVGNELHAFCLNDGKEELGFVLNLTNFYFNKNKDLAYNVFTKEVDFDNEEVLVIKCFENVNVEFVNKFFIGVIEAMANLLEENEIEVDYKEEDSVEDYLCNLLNDAFREALNIDKKWNEIK